MPLEIGGGIASFLGRGSVAITSQISRAVDASDEKRVRELVSAGAPLDHANATPFGLTFAYGTALHFAAARNFEPIVRLLLDGKFKDPGAARAPLAARINARAGMGRTPLLRASSSIVDTTVRALLSRGANVLLQDHGGLSPLFAHFSAGCTSSVAVALALAAAPGAEADFARQRNGATLLQQAICVGRPEEAVAALIRSAPASAIDLRGRDGSTPLMAAARCGRRELVRALLERGARQDMRMSPSGDTALHIAVKHREAGCVFELRLARAPAPPSESRIAIAARH
jgi:hypothetical protein